MAHVSKAALGIIAVLSGCGAGVAGVVGVADTDSSPPPDPELFVASISPTSASTDVLRSAPLVVQFSTRINPQSVTEDSFLVTTGDDDLEVRIPGAITISGGTAVEFRPDQPWPVLSEVDVALTTDLQSITGKALAVDFVSSFEVRDGEWREVLPPTTNGICIDVAALAGGEVLALIQSSPGELELWELDPPTGAWQGPTNMVSGAVSAVAHLAPFSSQSNRVSRNSLAVSDGGQVALVTSITNGPDTSIVARVRVSPGVWTDAEVVLDPQSGAGLEQVVTVFRVEELNVMWFDTLYRSRRRVNGVWEAIEEVAPASDPGGGRPMNDGFDLSSTTNGTLHAIFGSPPHHKVKSSGEAAWPSGPGASTGLQEISASVQIQGFDNGSALAVAAGLTGPSTGAAINSSILVPNSTTWTTLGSTASLNLAIGGDGFFTNVLMVGRPSGEALIVIVLDVEGRVTFGANTFVPFGWQFGETLAGPYVFPPSFDALRVGAGIDPRGNGVAFVVDTVQDQIGASRYLAEEMAWVPLPPLPATSGTQCITNPRITSIGTSGEFFAFVNVDCAASQMIAMSFR